MSEDIIVKTLRTFRHPYAYDRHTNSLVMLTEDEYQELVQVVSGEISAEQSPVIARHRQYGLFAPNIVNEIEHPGTVLIGQYLETRVLQIMLQVTQECNLRCKYCVYSGSYHSNRTHSSKRMTLETAKKAVDFLIAHSDELERVSLAFYGGEPLLEFDLIKQCVEYAKGKVEGKTVAFVLTTNGTLLSDSVVDFLAENDFGLNISLDGSKEEHDRNRKFVNGEGSFDAIIRNIRRIQERHPEYDKRVTVSTTINPHMDIGCVMEYFTTDEIFSDRAILFNEVVEKDHIEELEYDKDSYRIRNFEYMKMLFSLVGKLDRKHVSPLVTRAEGRVGQRKKGIGIHSELIQKWHHNGPCLPGVQRPMVRVDGALLPCERVNEEFDFFVIGTLDDGFNLDKVRSVLNIGKLTECECIACWGLRQCSMCSAQMEFDPVTLEPDKHRSCPKNLNAVDTGLYELCVLSEFGYDIEGMVTE